MLIIKKIWYKLKFIVTQTTDKIYIINKYMKNRNWKLKYLKDAIHYAFMFEEELREYVNNIIKNIQLEKARLNNEI